MNTLFNEDPLRRTKLRESHGRFCTKYQAEIDRKFRLIQKIENENIRLKHEVERWRRQAEALQELVITKTHEKCRY